MQLFKNKTAALNESQLLTTKRGSALVAQEIGAKSGFTLVEIIIVLAIVGLIFVIIFLAVTAAQRGQRDTARKDNVNRAVGIAQQRAGNANGVYPAPAATLTNWTANTPVTGLAQAAATKTVIDWRTSLTGCSVVAGYTNGGTTGYFDILLDDGTTHYCKDY